MRKVCIYTSGRMDYGLLRGVMEEIAASEELQLQILASGMHLSQEFGKTIDEMVQDGFRPDETIEILLSSDTPIGICKAMGLAMIGYGEAIQRLQPDMILVLGDRFETFCIAATAQVCLVPVVHIHGGETTEGAIDEAFRHSITKMSHLHFVSCEAYRQRIVQLGESPDSVFNVGSLGVENIRKTSLMTREQLSESIRFTLDCPYFIVTFHPVTLEQSTAEDQFKNLLNALGQVILDSNASIKIIFTKANADTDGCTINRLINEYVTGHSDKATAFASMGTLRYLSAMKHSSAVVGNSSSGIIEAPAFRVPTVNIGDRQKGRVQAPSIINCEPKVSSILKGIATALSPAFIDSLSGMSNPYERQNTSSTIVALLKKVKLEGLISKHFYDFAPVVRY